MGGDRGRNPTIYIVSCATTANQYTQVLATGTKSLKVQSRAATNLIYLGWTSGAVTGSIYWTLQANDVYEETDLALGKATLFVASPVAGAIAEVITWQ